MPFEVTELQLSLGGKPVLQDLSFSLPERGITGIIGANGSGKTTLLRALAGVIAPERGLISHEGVDISGLAPKARARAIAMLPQTGQAPPGLTVRQLVGRGRTPWLRPFLPMSREDHAAVDQALSAVGLRALEAEAVDRLSGGQRQRAWIALVLAQQSRTILLDEPLNFLDLPHQAELVQLLRQLRRERSVVMILHDLTIAARLCDHVLALQGGRLVAAGPARDVLTPESLEKTFGIAFTVASLGPAQAPVVLPQAL